MSTKQFTAQTFAWLRLLKSDRDTTALAVGLQLTEHFNEKHEGGCAWAGCGYMAKALGLNEATVVRAVHRMHQRGRLRVEWGKQGRGHSNQYWMIVAHHSDPKKGAPEQALNPEKPAPASAVKPAPASRKPAPAQENHIRTSGPYGTRGGRAEPPRRAPDGAPEEFQELLQLWQRPYGTNAEKARAAFNRVVGDGEVSPETILESARRWVAAREPSYLPALARWLDDGAWKFAPPIRRSTNGYHHKKNAVDVGAELVAAFRAEEGGAW